MILIQQVTLEARSPTNLLCHSVEVHICDIVVSDGVGSLCHGPKGLWLKVSLMLLVQHKY
jgi:hypothetical protein